MLAAENGRPTVEVVVVTYNRRVMLGECLDALAAQTHPPAGVTVIDNASTDGTREALEARAAREPGLRYVRLGRNGGGAEGFHVGVARGLETGAAWLWLMDDDCAPEPECLATLLAAPRASDPGTGALAPLVVTPEDDPMPLNRGWLRPRWFRSPIVGLSPEDMRAPEREIEFCSLVGPLVRSEVAARTAPPLRELFIWFDDLEYFSRLGRLGRIWLVPAARIVHKDVRQLRELTLWALVREFARGYPFGGRWKRLYGMRNLLFCGRRDGFFTPVRAASFVAASVIRGLCFEDHRRRTLWLTLMYARDGWRGVFRNLDPADWAALAEHPDPKRFLRERRLRYETPA